MGLEGGDLIDCGLFYVDDVTLAGSRSGDTCSIKGMSAKGSSIHSDVQTVNREAQSIQTIVNQISSSLGYTAKGDLAGTWTGVQKGTGLQFLQQLAKETGRIMKVEGTELVFFLLSKVQSGAVVATVNKADVKDFNITDQAKGRVAKVIVKSWDANKKQTVEATHETGVAGGGSQTIHTNAADSSAAKSRAEAAAADTGKKGVTFEITVPGDVRLRVGVRITTKGWGRFDRSWYIAEATHTVSTSSGYLTKLTLQQ
jgi:phage protein D